MKRWFAFAAGTVLAAAIVSSWSELRRYRRMSAM
jgi:hypothetical protein